MSTPQTHDALTQGELRVSKAKLDRFLSQDQTVKREVKEWGKQIATRILEELLKLFACPLRAVEIQTWPKNTARVGYYQNAVANAQAGGVYVRVHIDVLKSGPTPRVWLEARIDPAEREKGWVRDNESIVSAIVERYIREEGKGHSRNERKNDKVPLTSAKYLSFGSVLSEMSEDDTELVIRPKALKDFVADFDLMMGAIMRETLSQRQRRYRNLRGIIPLERAIEEIDESDSPILERAAVVRALLAAINSRPLVLLAGVSGTGKTQIAKRIGLARALGMLDDLEGREGSAVDRQYAALVPEVVEPIGDGEWVWVRMPTFEQNDRSEQPNETNDAAEQADQPEGDDAEEDGEGEDESESSDDATESAGIDVNRIFAIEPVQSDWKESSSLWGWYHPLDGGAFHGSAVLRVFLDAWQRLGPKQRASHVIVLDEMNLSRLEHYGSDLLSAMENPGEAMISLHRVGHDAPMAGGPAERVPAKIGWRAGLIVIGTVNVDETTFSFAPKVLDRAAVLEFVDVDLQRYFTEVGRLAEWKALGPWFDAVQAATRPFNLHLGYRAAREVAAVVKGELGDRVDGWDKSRLVSVLDGQLRNKVLPRVRGPRGSAEPVLVGLMALALVGAAGARSKAAELDTLARAGWLGEEAAAVRASLQAGSAAEKAWQMLMRLRDVGFTGFF